MMVYILEFFSCYTSNSSDNGAAGLQDCCRNSDTEAGGTNCH
ncbi:unnamed protein product [Staurois parvus]|uniref:Uncharacterized protein n=1 Tax=Staurois parvus TaxID=386267 RepID=A0ABN9HFD0_9NEOB|nr:unnamed protein product [Staurois parvus]